MKFGSKRIASCNIVVVVVAAAATAAFYITPYNKHKCVYAIHVMSYECILFHGDLFSRLHSVCDGLVSVSFEQNRSTYTILYSHTNHSLTGLQSV